MSEGRKVEKMKVGTTPRPKPARGIGGATYDKLS